MNDDISADRPDDPDGIRRTIEEMSRRTAEEVNRATGLGENIDRTNDRDVRLVSGPTWDTYIRCWGYAFDFLNDKLCEGLLPRPLFTLATDQACYSYYTPDRYGAPNGTGRVDGFAINPITLRSLTAEEALSWLAHEMAHQKRYRSDMPKPLVGYHDQRWARIMLDIGLIPSSNGKEGGAKTGYRMSHYIEPGGRFELACTELLQRGFGIRYVEMKGMASFDEGEAERRRKKKESKTKFTCPSCRDLNAWAKLSSKLMCGVCLVAMVVADE